MKFLLKHITVLLTGLFVLISLSVSANNITVLAWPGGPAETALKKVVDNYNKTSDS
jgi:multiple sugar transport system substrate-binding protein